MVGGISCLPCAAGQYNPDGGGAGPDKAAGGGGSCLHCPIGKFQPQRGGHECISCALGSVTTHGGDGDVFGGACSRCGAGKYAFAGLCVGCARGRFARGGGTSCDACPAGKYANGQGTKACAPCEAGRFNKRKQDVSCQWCAAGRANGATGQRACKACAAGRFSRGDGAKMCTACPDGQKSISTSGATGCRHLGMSWSAKDGKLEHAKDDASIAVAGLDDANPALVSASEDRKHGARASKLTIDGDIGGDSGDEDDLDTPDEEHGVGIPVATGGRLASAASCRAQTMFGGWSACDRACGAGRRYRYKLRITCGRPPDELPESKRFKQSKRCNTKPCPHGQGRAPKGTVKVPPVGEY